MHFTSLLSVTLACLAGRLRCWVSVCVLLPFCQLHQLWVLKHCLYCGCVCVCVCVCVFVCVQLISLLLKALGFFFSSWSTSTWGYNMHFTSLLSVTLACLAGRLRRWVSVCVLLPFCQLHQLWVLKHCLYCGCVCSCVCN